MPRPLSQWPLQTATVSGWGAVAVAVVLSLLSVQALPSGDYWVFLGQRGLGQTFDAVWAQNEYHLMLLPRLIFVLDELAGWGGHYLLSLAAALISLAVIAGTGAQSIAADASIAPALRRPLTAIIAALTFSATHVELLTEPQKLWIPMAMAGCTLSLHLSSRSCLGTGSNGAFAAAMALVVAASVSGIIGLLCLPVLALLVILLRGGPARLAGIGAAGVIAGLLFFTHMDLPPPRGGIALLLTDPGPVLLALGRFFGAPAARILAGSPLSGQAGPVSTALGLAGTALAGWFWLSFLMAPRAWASRALWLGLLLLALFWGGSVSLRDAVEPGPVLSRYDLIVSLFWSALLVLGISRAPGVGRPVLPVVALCLLLLQLPFGLRAHGQAEAVAALRVALAVGVEDPDVEGRKAYVMDMRWVRPLLLARTLPPFDHQAPRTLGATAQTPKDAPTCAGRVDASVSLPDGGLRMQGHGGVPGGRFPLRIVDSDGRLVGLGERWRGNAGLLDGGSSADGWLAYAVPGARPPLSIHVHGDNACLMPASTR